MEDMLRIDKLLDFCDVPQLFVARDAFETLYLCLLYEDEPACRYTGIRISARLLDAFLTGKADLRQLFLQPENEREYYDVVFQSGEYRKTLSDEKTLPEDKLPTAGYVLPEDARENIATCLRNLYASSDGRACDSAYGVLHSTTHRSIFLIRLLKFTPILNNRLGSASKGCA